MLGFDELHAVTKRARLKRSFVRLSNTPKLSATSLRVLSSSMVLTTFAIISKSLRVMCIPSEKKNSSDALCASYERKKISFGAFAPRICDPALEAGRSCLCVERHALDRWPHRLPLLNEPFKALRALS